MEVYNKINDQNSDGEYHHELLSSPLLISELSFKCIADPVRYSQGTCTDMVIQLIPHTIDYINRCFIRKSVEDNVATQKVFSLKIVIGPVSKRMSASCPKGIWLPSEDGIKIRLIISGVLRYSRAYLTRTG